MDPSHMLSLPSLGAALLRTCKRLRLRLFYGCFLVIEAHGGRCGLSGVFVCFPPVVLGGGLSLGAIARPILQCFPWVSGQVLSLLDAHSPKASHPTKRGLPSPANQPSHHYCLRATLTPYILAKKYKPWHKSGADVTGVVWWRAVGR